MCSFSNGCDDRDIELVIILINLELNQIAGWLVVNKLWLDVQTTSTYSITAKRFFTENDISRLLINNTIFERITEFDFLELISNKCMNWNCHTHKKLLTKYYVCYA